MDAWHQDRGLHGGGVAQKETGGKGGTGWLPIVRRGHCERMGRNSTTRSPAFPIVWTADTDSRQGDCEVHDDGELSPCPWDMDCKHCSKSNGFALSERPNAGMKGPVQAQGIPGTLTQGPVSAVYLGADLVFPGARLAWWPIGLAESDGRGSQLWRQRPGSKATVGILKGSCSTDSGASLVDGSPSNNATSRRASLECRTWLSSDPPATLSANNPWGCS
jgi:hypothetical protein